jgi:hypothetical protein
MAPNASKAATPPAMPPMAPPEITRLCGFNGVPLLVASGVPVVVELAIRTDALRKSKSVHLRRNSLAVNGL